jgi:predicted amidohydrolase YtcJ
VDWEIHCNYVFVLLALPAWSAVGQTCVHPAMPTSLAKNAEVFVWIDSQRHELKNAGLYAEDGIIRQVAKNEEFPSTADTVFDLSGKIVLIGFVKAHHHLNQTLVFRNLPAAQNNNRRDAQSLCIRNGQRLSLSSQKLWI